MGADPEIQEFMNYFVEELRECISTEEQVIQTEHSLSEKLKSWEAIMMHLDEFFPTWGKQFHRFSREIGNYFFDIRELIEGDENTSFEIQKESKKNLNFLHDQVGHREWVGVQKEYNKITKRRKKKLRVQSDHLKKIHAQFIGLMKLTKREIPIIAQGSHLTVPPQNREGVTKLAEHYILQLYKFARAYERIFRHLWRKERILEKKIK